MSDDGITPADILRPGREAAYAQYQDALRRLLILSYTGIGLEAQRA